jgi:hypothetical protein
MTERTLNWARGSIALAVAVSLPLSAAPAMPKAAAQPATAVADAPVSYVAAENREIRIVVDEVIAAGTKAYLPKDKNWLQIHVTITNKGAGTLSFSDIRERLPNGTVVAAATSLADLNKPPSMTGMVGRQMGLGTAGAAAGMFLVPPLAIAAGLATVFGGALGFDKRQKKNARLQKSILQPSPIAPGTAVAGWVYVPALRDHTGLIAFYMGAAGVQSLPIWRAGYEPPPPPAPVIIETPVKKPGAAARKPKVRSRK